MAPALPCNFGGASNVLATCLGFQDRLLARMDTPGSRVRESCLLIPPSHFEVPPMLSNAKLVCGAVPRAIERKSRASKTNDVRVDLSADVAQSVRSARAQCIVGDNSRARAVKKKKTFTWKTCAKSPARNDRPQAG